MRDIKIKIQNKKYGDFDGYEIKLKGFNKTPRYFYSPLGFKIGKYLLEKFKENIGNFQLVIDKNKESNINKTKSKNTEIILNITDYEMARNAFLRNYRAEGEKSANNILAEKFPNYFKREKIKETYRKGKLSNLLRKEVNLPDLSQNDIKTFINFLPKFKKHKVKNKKDIENLFKGKNVLHYLHLEKMLDIFESKLKNNKLKEGAWQNFLKENLVILNPGYIKLIDKPNIEIVDTKFPDFLLITIDYYLDVYEIKTPKTQLLSYDDNHKNYFWSSNISQAISQIENYIEEVVSMKDKLTNRIRDKHKIDLRIIKPRGIIIAGNSKQLDNHNKTDDFRLLNESLRNCEIIPFDKFLERFRTLSDLLKKDK